MHFNRYRIDIVVILGLLILSIVYNRLFFAPLNEAGLLSLEGSVFLRFEGASVQSVYLPLSALVMTGLVIAYAWRKPRRPSMMYGLSLAALAQYNFWFNVVQASPGSVTTSNIFFPQVASAMTQAEIAQDIAIGVLWVLLMIKLVTYLYEIYLDMRHSKAG
jgi:hypothetical protein